ncbi:UDP-N-acetylmuramoyl-L-alanine--D-glutamate ligase [Candidatus Purcelliella pentastirinorum]|uniref:UDP-N-acetylmuramoyl-L-alanine--D-glutamate ligase n=1 Tax=Candidatus Purcelliella pentastirinorum TaxID=472834 RepID=UPI002368D10B|nr:UDP-N-acetylmuramoyl-L-alanine--D-glutamate ligase [Candidatus Purcelliella pentastirinorum]WDI79041.1 UDP-N-acetylmuramoyl-L-alanine--D-glutamate ligase [Candidatus Purcelliella pentastirinorum]WDR80179.1 UDP-N-acetylmuramoyl-L-alanine--D-glutamate ligase [Candidatus Purcelliella pentastirinorum]
MYNYYNKKIVVIGLGKTGLSCINFFLRRDIVPMVLDTRKFPPELNKLPNFVKYKLGPLRCEDIILFDLIIVSPGLSLNDPTLLYARKIGIEIIGDIELFCRELQFISIVAITGSNGKSTVSSLLYRIANASGIKVILAGNIGIPVLDTLKNYAQLYILELSSFQLETIFSLSSEVSTVLNVCCDHMDRYFNDIIEYRSFKLRIYNNSKICLVNVDDILTFPFNKIFRKCISFGSYTGDYCMVKYRGSLWLSVYGERVLNTSKIKLFGFYNYINCLAVLAISDIMFFPRKIILRIFSLFKGLKHRFQLVHQRNNIKWINDSKSTNLSSTLAALINFKNNIGFVWLFLGGILKSTFLSSLDGYLYKDKIKLCCFGKDGMFIYSSYPNISVYRNTIEELVINIMPIVRSGDVILFSPACSSFDQFKNFEERGKYFLRIANKY